MMARIEAPIAANQTLAAVSAIFTWAIKEEMLPANPCKLVDRNQTSPVNASWPIPKSRSSGRHWTTPIRCTPPRCG